MAHAHASHYAEPLVIAQFEDEIHIVCGPFSVRMTREEAAQLAADLLNAAGVTAADAAAEG